MSNYRTQINEIINAIDHLMVQTRILNDKDLNNSLAIAQGQMFRAQKQLDQIHQGLVNSPVPSWY